VFWPLLLAIYLSIGLKFRNVKKHVYPSAVITHTIAWYLQISLLCPITFLDNRSPVLQSMSFASVSHVSDDCLGISVMSKLTYISRAVWYSFWTLEFKFPPSEVKPITYCAVQYLGNIICAIFKVSSRYCVCLRTYLRSILSPTSFSTTYFFSPNIIGLVLTMHFSVLITDQWHKFATYLWQAVEFTSALNCPSFVLCTS
jgi:hypothetical protein